MNLNKRVIGAAIAQIIVLIGIGVFAFYYIETGKEDEEEPSLRLQPDESYEGRLNSVHLVIAYNKSSDSFKGNVYNPTDQSLYNVRVEVAGGSFV